MKKKKPPKITVSDVGLVLSILNLIFILFCEFVLK